MNFRLNLIKINYGYSLLIFILLYSSLIFGFFFNEDSNVRAQEFIFKGTEVVVVEHEVYWYDEATGLYLIKNNIKDQWEYVSLNVLKWKLKTEVLDNYYYTNKFDPKKKLDTTNNLFVNEDGGKIEYSESKILEWLSTIRESKSNTNSNTKSSK